MHVIFGILMAAAILVIAKPIAKKKLYADLGTVSKLSCLNQRNSGRPRHYADQDRNRYGTNCLITYGKGLWLGANTFFTVNGIINVRNGTGSTITST